MAKLVRVLKATLKGPQGGSSVRLSAVEVPARLL
jgi:hypothetical protein